MIGILYANTQCSIMSFLMAATEKWNMKQKSTCTLHLSLLEYGGPVNWDDLRYKMN